MEYNPIFTHPNSASKSIAKMDVNPSCNPESKLEVSSSGSPFDWHITTPRLYISYLNPSSTAHCDMTVSLLHSPSSVKYNPSGPSLIPNAEAARAFIAGSVDKTTRTGYGRYLISLRTGGSDEHENFSQRDLELVGVVTMQLNRIPSIPGPLIPDVGFNILPKYHGKGIANEAATHMMKWFREQKGVKAFAGSR
jgi:hypothetical protein